MWNNNTTLRSNMMRNRTLAILVAMALVVSACAKSPEQLLASAQESAAEKDYQTAIITLKNLLQVDPDNVDARVLLAEASLVTGDPLSAEKELQKAADEGASDGEFMALYYRTQLTLGRHGAVLELLSEEEAAAGLTSAQANQFRGESLLGLGSSIEAEATFREILAEDSNNAMASWGLAAAKASQGETAEAATMAAKITTDHPDFARGWLLKGQMGLRSGKLEDAEKDLRVAVDKAAATPDRIIEIVALASLGDAQLGLRDIDAAEPTIRRLAGITGPTPIARMLVARLAIAQDDLTLAAGELDQLLTADPNNVQAMLLRASVHVKQGTYAQAEALLNRVLAQHPQNLAAVRLLGVTQIQDKDPEAAAATLSPLLAEDNDPRLSIFASQALLESGDPERAIEVLEKSLADDPENVDMKLRLAASYLSASRAPDAQAVAESMPEDTGFRREIILAFAHAAQDRMDESQAIVDKVVADNADDTSALTLAADYYRRRGDADAAHDLLARAVEADATNMTARYSLARSQYLRNNYEEASGHLEAVLDSDPEHIRALSLLADIEARYGNTDRSVDLLKRAVAADSTAATPRIMLARAQVRVGSPRAAEETANEAASLAPENPSIIAAAASILLDTGSPREAQGYLSLATELRPDVAGYWYELARAQVAVDEPVEARKALEKALELQPDMVRAASALMMMELEDGNTSQAERILNDLKAADPESLAPLALEFNMLTRLKRFDEAATVQQRLYDASPSVQKAITLYQANRRAGRENPEAVLLDWQERHPDDGASALLLAQHYESVGDMDEAVRHYEIAVTANPEDGISLNNLAWIYHERGDPRAEELARRAYAIIPTAGSVLDTLGWILVTNDKADEGYPLLEEAIEKYPNMKDAKYHFAVASNKLGRKDRSIEILKELLADGAPFGERADAEALLAELE